MNFLPPGHAETADLAVIIVSWNVRQAVLDNLAKLQASQGSVTAEVILIDNASDDATAQAVRAAYPSVLVMANADNRGFAAANNQGLQAMKARHALLLNPDMLVDADSLQKTVDYLDAHGRCAIMGARLRRSDGSFYPSVRRFPDVWSQLLIVLKLARLFPGSLARYLAKDLDFTREQIVDSVRGSYFAISGAFLKQVPGLDERFFIWFEEVDYCRSAKAHDMEVRFVPDITAVDRGSLSFKQNKRLLAQKRFTRSLVQYFQKWQPGWQSVVLAVARPIGLALAWLADLL